MEEKDLDRLFRQKLDNFEATPSSQAWQQLEQSLQHKKERKVWPYLSGIAASLLLLMGIWGGMELAQPATPEKPLAAEETGKPAVAAVPSAAIQESKPLPTAVAEAGEASSKSVPRKAAAEIKVPAPVKSIKKATVDQKPSSQVAFSKTPVPAVEKLPELELESKSFQAQSLAALEVKVKIERPEPEYEEVVIRYAPNEQEAIAVADTKTSPSEEKDLSARKLLGFFKKVTNNNTLADLRDAKDQLLSLDRLSSPE